MGPCWVFRVLRTGLLIPGTELDVDTRTIKPGVEVLDSFVELLLAWHHLGKGVGVRAEGEGCQ